MHPAELSVGTQDKSGPHHRPRNHRYSPYRKGTRTAIQNLSEKELRSWIIVSARKRKPKGGQEEIVVGGKPHQTYRHRELLNTDKPIDTNGERRKRTRPRETTNFRSDRRGWKTPGTPQQSKGAAEYKHTDGSHRQKGNFKNDNNSEKGRKLNPT